MTQNILFRADSSFTIGTGHIMRDLVLASKYRKNGDSVTFATLNLEGNINHTIKEHQFQIKILQTNHIEEIIQLILIHKIDLIVIDHYDITFSYEEQLKKETNVKILSFDDTYEKHHCDILLNHNIYADPKRYAHLVPQECELKCGSKYTLLRDEFLIEKKKKTILVAMGGADSSNLNIKILKTLKTFTDIKVIVITTSANQNLDTLNQYVHNKKWIKLAINSSKIAKLMKKSDLAITTPSVTLNELYFMNVPFIAIKIAKNQKEMYQYLKKNNFNVLKKFKKHSLLIQLENYLKENR